jgi:predicted TIM-barrel enzyme
VVAAHLGAPTKGSIGATTAATLEEVSAKVQALCDAAGCVTPDTFTLRHDGPIFVSDAKQCIFYNAEGANML